MFPDLATFALPRAGSLLLDLLSKTPSPFGTCALWQESPPCFHLDKILVRTWQNRAPKVVSHVQLDSHALKRLKVFRILPSIASGPSGDITPTKAFFHLFVCPRVGWTPEVITVHAQKIKFTSNTKHIDFHEVSGASSTSLPAKTAEIIKNLHTQIPSPKQLVQVKLFPIIRTGIRTTHPSHANELAEMLCSDSSTPVAFSCCPPSFPKSQITAQET